MKEDIQFDVIRSERKTTTLTVTREGKVVVRSPYGVSEQEIAEFVARHERWLQKHLSDSREGKAIDLRDGAKIQVYGKLYTVATGLHALLSYNFIYLPAEEREEAFRNLLRRLTRTRMKELLDKICMRYGLSYTRLSVSSGRGRWGSCSAKRTITFTFRTAFLPDDLAEYLAAHELCHTLHMDHSSAFWHEVARIVPDYLIRRRKLKGYLWAMNSL